ncbi:MAG TPA: hypothetical protein DD001_09675 [Microcoleaceae bacterium UBA10368]|jgi:hypothetical protein|nr:hypothetical protein [Microcoleaceae cyanobacterium UBA11344]HBK97568.1 hypothetical protein [Microcoleaceae cyanobacterium UBA10368]
MRGVTPFCEDVVKICLDICKVKLSGQPQGDCPYKDGKRGFCRGSATPTPRAYPPAQTLEWAFQASGLFTRGLPLQENETALLNQGSRGVGGVGQEHSKSPFLRGI